VDEHDYQFKKKHIERFLADGDKVKATIFFRGREMAHPEIGRRILERLIEELAEVAIAETMPRQEGNQMHTILSQRAGRKARRRRKRRPRRSRPRRRQNEAVRQQGRHHAETEDAQGRRQAVQEDRIGQVRAGKAFKQHILTSKTRSRKRGLRTVVVAADQAKLRHMLPNARAVQ
jgi:ribosomal protein L35